MRKSKLLSISPGVPMSSNPLLLNGNLIEAQNSSDLNGGRGGPSGGGAIAALSGSANVVTTVHAEDGFGMGDITVVDANNITIPPQ